MFRSSLLDCPLNSNLVGDPSGPDQIAVHERTAMLQSEVVYLLTIDNRDHDFVVANDALTRCRTEGQGVCARAVNCFIIHRDDAEITLFISMSDVEVAWRC